MPRQKISYDSRYEDHQLHNGNNGFIVNITQGYHDRLEYMVNKHNQVAVSHLDVTAPEGISPAQLTKAISGSLDSLKKKLKKEKTEAQIGWVLEATNSGAAEPKPHIHIGIIKNASKSQNGMGDALYLDKILAKRLGDPSRTGYVRCNPPDLERYDQQPEFNTKNNMAIKIRRNKPGADKQIDNTLNWLNYQSKLATKGFAPPRQREYGFTCLPKDDGKSIVQDNRHGGDQLRADDVQS